MRCKRCGETRNVDAETFVCRYCLGTEGETNVIELAEAQVDARPAVGRKYADGVARGPFPVCSLCACSIIPTDTTTTKAGGGLVHARCYSAERGW